MLTMAKQVIDIGPDFSPFPAGRYKEDGPYTGEHFREKFLECFNVNENVTIHLDSTAGYGSSFLEEAFGGLVRKEKFTKEKLKEKFKFVTEDTSLENEIWGYINDAEPE